MNKLKMSQTSFGKRFILCLLLCFGVFAYTEEANNAVSPTSDIMDSLEDWTDYFYSYKKIDRFINPNTEQVITKKDIIIAMQGIGKWESDNKPTKITVEPKIKSFSYGIYCVLSSTAKGTGRWDGKDIKDLLKIGKNTEVAVCYFSDKLVYYKGDIDKAICAYNAGKYRVSKRTGRILNSYYYENVTKIIKDIKEYNKCKLRATN